MLNALKKLGKKTLALLLFIILIPIIVIILIVALQSCERKVSYEQYESRMIIAAKKYFKINNSIPNLEGESSTVLLSTLIDRGYIKAPAKALGDDTCAGSVIVRRNVSNVYGENEQELNYLVNLKCKNYNSKSLLANLMGDLTTSDSGLYDDGTSYVYRGADVNNRVRFYGVDYRVLSIDKNNIVRLIRSYNDGTNKVWDDKYNSELDGNYGKSIYKDSQILKTLMSEYNSPKKNTESAKRHIIPYSVCIGKRDRDDYRISYDVDCSEKLDNQPISLINVSDYARASLDPECNSTISKSCNNYNYLKGIVTTSWTSNVSSNNSYDVYYIFNGQSGTTYASSYGAYNYVIYIDGYETIKSGNGTDLHPYVIE